MRLFLFIMAFVSFTFCAQAQNIDQDAVKKKINSVAASINSLQCDFTQTKQLKMLNDKMVSKGKMYYQQGGKLRWEYTTPYIYTFVLNDSKVLITKNNRNDIIDVNQSNIFKEIARIMVNCMTGKCLSNEKDFKVTMSETSKEWIAQMIPQNKTMSKIFKSIILKFNKQKSMISSVELVENNGDRTMIELNGIKTNINIDAKKFSVN